MFECYEKERVNPNDFRWIDPTETACDECGAVLEDGEFLKLSNYCGKCKECWISLAEKCDYDLGLKFLTETKSLPYFICEGVFKSEVTFQKISSDLVEEAKMVFARKKLEDLLFDKKEFLCQLRVYIKNSLEDSLLGWTDWADAWLEYKKEVK